jgi:hypothetical protein
MGGELGWRAETITVLVDDRKSGHGGEGSIHNRKE